MPINPKIRQCNHIKFDDSRCGSPALTGQPRCYFHAHVLRKHKEFLLPALEDPTAIQVAIMEVMGAVLDDRIDRGKANTLLYALQIAHANLNSMMMVAMAKEEDEDDGPAGGLAELLLRKLDQDMPVKDPEITAALNNIDSPPQT